MDVVPQHKDLESGECRDRKEVWSCYDLACIREHRIMASFFVIESTGLVKVKAPGVKIR